MAATSYPWQRRLTRGAFFALFLLAPPLDLFRLDFIQGHFVFLGMDWTLGLAAFQRHEIGPGEAVANLLHAELTRNQALFIGVATLIFALEFLLARHLFCRFGCAIGFAQSVIWMANPKAMVVSFDKPRGGACRDCVQACDNVCPMRLNPRKNKRHMFTCTQCSERIQACDQVMKDDPPGLLRFARGQKQTAWTSPPKESR